MKSNSLPQEVDRPLVAPKPTRSPLADAFYYEQEDRLDIEKGILAVAFLLKWESGGGNRPIAPLVADGLGEILEHAAQQIATRVYGQAEIEDAGFDWHKIERKEA